jgi:hypothetical protein
MSSECFVITGLFQWDCDLCRWVGSSCKKISECKPESRRAHADRLIAALDEITGHPCGNCINHWYCYTGKPDSKACSKVKSKEEKEAHLKYWRDKWKRDEKNAM